MRRAKPKPIRSDLSDSGQISTWTRRLGITSDDLKRVVWKRNPSVISRLLCYEKRPF